MEMIKAVGKSCKSRVMHLTEWEAGMLFVSALALNVVLVALLALQA
tara:strand:+ start:675 stop:812 length:138 start_codon:yes stop_codon:yes gene_type:complete